MPSAAGGKRPLLFALALLLVAGVARRVLSSPVFFDGQGLALWLDLALDHLRTDGRLGYWFGEMWAGMPPWLLAPSFPVWWIIGLAWWLDTDTAIKLAGFLAQLAAAGGAFVFARSLVRRPWPPVMAAVVYALHPTFISHVSLGGRIGDAWVIAALPWFAWSLRGALKDARTGLVVGAGLLGAFAVLQQAQASYALMLLGACFLVLELVRSGWRDVGALLKRAGGVVAIVLGCSAFWLIPFSQHNDAFVLTPNAEVEAALRSTAAGSVAGRPSELLRRSRGLDVTDLYAEAAHDAAPFYLGWTALGLTLVAVGSLPRRREDGYLTTTLLVSALGLWLSIGVVPLWRSDIASAGGALPFGVIGVVTGVLIGSLISELGLSRRAAAAGAVAAAALLVGVPYVAPFSTLRSFIPFLDFLRYPPRFLPLAALGVAVGSAAGLAVIAGWARRLGAERGAVLTAAVCLLALGAFLWDISPYRTYHLREDSEVARAYGADRTRYENVGRWLRSRGEGGRVAVPDFQDPRTIRGLLDAGVEPVVGYPHAVAHRGVSDIAAFGWRGPGAYRLRALGLLGARSILTMPSNGDIDPRAEVVDGVTVLRNPVALPLVRTYDLVAVVDDPETTAPLAASLAHRGVGVVRRTSASSQDPLAPVAIRNRTLMVDGAQRSADRLLDGELAHARAVGTWVGRERRVERPILREATAGATITVDHDGLEGIGVLLQGDAQDAVLRLHALTGDGREVGPVVATARPTGVSELGLIRFLFEPTQTPEPGRYVFTLTCPDCPASGAPAMASASAEDGTGDLVLSGQLHTDRRAAFAPLYEQLPAANAPEAVPDATRRQASWDVRLTTDRPVLLVVAETAFPGWEATVDGREVEVFEADGALIGVALPAGSHLVSLRFIQPAAVATGRAVTAATLVIVLVVAVRAIRRRRDERPHPASTGTGTTSPRAERGDRRSRR